MPSDDRCAPLLVRLDSGNDAAENIGILIEDGSWFIIKRNPRGGETKEAWLEDVKGWCKDIRTPRDGKTVYVGTSYKDVRYTDSAGNKHKQGIRIGYEVTERTIDGKGQYLCVPDIEMNTWWTNLGLSDDEIIQLYHAHGESEQYHGEIKSDMDVERLPSGKFETNELVMELVILAYNILRMIGQESLKKGDSRKLKRPVRRRRLRTVINNLILIAGHVTEHGRRVILALGRSNVWRHAFLRLYRRFALAKKNKLQFDEAAILGVPHDGLFVDALPLKPDRIPAGYSTRSVISTQKLYVVCNISGETRFRR